MGCFLCVSSELFLGCVVQQRRRRPRGRGRRRRSDAVDLAQRCVSLCRHFLWRQRVPQPHAAIAPRPPTAAVNIRSRDPQPQHDDVFLSKSMSESRRIPTLIVPILDLMYAPPSSAPGVCSSVSSAAPPAAAESGSGVSADGPTFLL